MKCFLRLSTALLLLSISIQVSKAESINEDGLYDGIGEEVKTAGGVLSVSENSDEQKELLFNGKATGITEDDIFIVRKYKINGDDVFLIGSQCSGSACPYTLDVIRLSPSGDASKAQFSKKNESILISTAHPVDVNADGNRLTISGMAVPDPGKRPYKETWTYANGVISTSKAPSTQPPKHKISYGSMAFRAIAIVAQAQGCLLDVKDPDIIKNPKVGHIRVDEIRFNKGCPVQDIGVLYGVGEASFLPVIPGRSDVFQFVYWEGGRTELFRRLKNEDFATEPKRLAIEKAGK